jgi:LacI family transcriptional regulator
MGRDGAKRDFLAPRKCYNAATRGDNALASLSAVEDENAMPTIRDVAKRAHVAPITVSRVINQSGYVSEDKRARVMEAISELKYIPSALPESFRSKKTNTIGLIVPDVTNPFFNMVARGVEDTCNEHQLSVILCNSDEKHEKIKQYALALLKRQVDGFLIVPTSQDADILHTIERQDVPAILIDRVVPHVTIDTVRSASEDGAYMLMQYLINLGHARIAFLCSSLSLSTSHERLAGYARALAEAGLPMHQELLRFGDPTEEDGYHMTREVMLDPLAKPTAIFAGNNLLSVGAIKMLEELQLRIPEDISVVAFDEQLMYPTPFLTVAVQQPYLLGVQAAELLIEQMSGKAAAGTRDVVLPVRLVVRESCAAHVHLPKG